MKNPRGFFTFEWGFFTFECGAFTFERAAVASDGGPEAEVLPYGAFTCRFA
jgi:hypothetical protein